VIFSQKISGLISFFEQIPINLRMADSSKRTARGVATNWQEISCILDWLELDVKNFNLINVGGQKDAKGGGRAKAEED